MQNRLEVYATDDETSEIRIFVYFRRWCISTRRCWVVRCRDGAAAASHVRKRRGEQAGLLLRHERLLLLTCGKRRGEEAGLLCPQPWTSAEVGREMWKQEP
jgi:hypothetical protein